MSKPMFEDRSGSKRESFGRSTWLSVAEAARLCGVTDHTVRFWIATRRLAADRSGPEPRIAFADLQPYLAAATPTLCDAPRELRPANGWREAPPADSGSLQTEPEPSADAPSNVSGDGPGLDRPALASDPDRDRAQIDALQARVARLQATVAEQQAEIAARRREVEELQLLLQRAQPGTLPPPRPEGAPSTTSVERPAEAPRPWWDRLLWWRR